MTESLITFVDNWLRLESQFWPYLGGAFGVSVSIAWLSRESWLWRVFLLLAVTIASFEFIPILLLPDVSESLVQRRIEMPANRTWELVACSAVGFLGVFVLLRYAGGAIDVAFARLTRRSSLARNQRTDIRMMSKHLPNAQRQYEPTKYFKLAKGIFVGLDETRRPVYIQFDHWRRSHCQILGTTGSGKGVVGQILLTQAVQFGETVVVIDPKNDEFLPHVLCCKAAELSVPYIYVDLTANVGQWNPLADKSAAEIRELLGAAFGLADKGTDADIYRLDDRRTARAFADLAVDRKQTIREALLRLVAEQPDVVEKGRKFVADLEEIALLSVTQTTGGLNLSSQLEGGGFVYVRGALRDPAVLKLQRLFLVSLVQHIECRDRESARPVCIFLDEFRFVVSRPAIEALASIRDKRAHMLIAHQSLGDLRDCPADLDAESVVAAVNENCRLKLTYQIQDPDTADWLARMSGSILVDDETRRVKTNLGLAETHEPERTLRQAERPLVDNNMLQALPERCAVLFGAGLAQFVFTSPINVIKTDQALLPTYSDGIECAGRTDARPAPRSLAEDVLDVD